MRVIVRLALLFLLFSGCNRQGLSPGDNAPPFTAELLSGGSLSLDQYLGKIVVLNFWASWCQPCIAELADLEQLQQRFKNQDLVVIGVGVDDSVEELREFQRSYGLTYPLVVDKEGSIKENYKLRGVPETFLIDRSGKILLFTDPDSGMPEPKIVGPRAWGSSAVATQLQALLDAADRGRSALP